MFTDCCCCGYILHFEDFQLLYEVDYDDCHIMGICERCGSGFPIWFHNLTEKGIRGVEYLLNEKYRSSLYLMALDVFVEKYFLQPEKARELLPKLMLKDYYEERKRLTLKKCVTFYFHFWK